MASGKTNAIILSAGFGTRMKGYTKDLPKPMLPLDNKPLIEYTIRQLVACGISDIAMNLHYLGEKIKNHFGDGKKFGANITYLHEDAPSGTAGGVKKLSSFVQSADSTIVIYGDIISDLNYEKLISFHLKHNKMATVVVHRRKKSNSIIDFNSQNQITQFIERPSEDILQKYTNEFWVNSAIYCFQSSVLELIKDGGVQDFPKDVFPLVMEKNELYAYPLEGHRVAIDTEEKYKEAQEKLNEFQFAFNR